LKNYLGLVKYDVPTNLGDQKAAKRLTDVRKQLVRWDNEFARLTRTAKSKWTNVLHYNWHDCNGMRAVTVRAATELQ
jgi:expansin (peptidoglycan-binding protein)